jgi:hypothetical protein
MKSSNVAYLKYELVVIGVGDYIGTYLYLNVN